MAQGKLFEHDSWPIADPRVAKTERPRLTKQMHAILEILEGGPCLNTELARIAIRYSARIHELRKMGYVIEITSENLKTGIRQYELKGDKND